MSRDLRQQLEQIPGFREAERRALPDKEASLAIARARARRNMTVGEFAKLLHISVAALSRLESGNFDHGGE